ncbi:MAG: competence/damage-inducible protein A [Proteobacteria bacterium]|nr:competence/damage-inducible protein A [Pseudomonadota bacterium]
MDLRAEIITIGNELISGVQIDTNGSFLAERLQSRGIPVQRLVSVGDDASSVAQALRESMKRTEVILVTGGLGPTSDDITTEAAARFLGRTLQLYQEALKHIKNLMCSLGVEMTDAQKKQAYIPEGAELIPNPIGSAYGYLIKEANRLLFFLPGVPREMEAMVEGTIFPRLEKERKGRLHYRARTLMVFGITESRADELLKDLPPQHEDVQISFLPHFPEIEIRITVHSSSSQEADEKLLYWEKETGKRLDPYIFGVDGKTMEEVVGKLLREANATIAVAESCTGGLIGHRLTNVPGSSDYVDQIVVTYSNKAKVDLLNVPEDIITAHGAVSEPTAQFMAQGVKNLAGTTIGLSTTGIAGPGGGSPDKPVGTVFISLTDGNETWTKSYHFSGDRLQIKQLTSQVALNRVRKYLLQKI